MKFKKIMFFTVIVLILLSFNAVTAVDENFDNETVKINPDDSTMDVTFDDEYGIEDVDELREFDLSNEIISENKSVSMEVNIWDDDIKQNMYELTPEEVSGKFVKVHLSEKVSGTLSLYMDNVFIANKTIKNKNHYFNLDVGGMGEHVALVKYSGDDNYVPTSASIKFEIYPGYKSFTDLNKLLQSCNWYDEIKLTHDFIFNNVTDVNFTEGIYIDKTITIDGQGHEIDAKHLARIFYAGFGNLTVKNIYLKNGFTHNKGGAIFAINGVFAVNSTFLNNLAQDGGAISSEWRSVSVINSTFINNIVKNFDQGYISRAGAILSYIDILSFNSTFINNTANFGGVFRNEQGYISLNNSIFINNTAVYSGGVVHTDGNVDVTNSTFFNNAAQLYGGAIATFGKESSKVTVKFSNFTNNTSSHYAGAILAATGLDFLNSVCMDNYAEHEGGVIVSYGDVLINNSSFKNNFAGGFGGVLYGYDISASFLNSTFEGNHATGGGIMYVVGYTLISNSNCTDNSAIRGGAIFNEGNVDILNSNFVNNHAQSASAVYSDTITIINSIFRNSGEIPQNIILGEINLVNSTIFENGVDVTSSYLNINSNTQSSKSSKKQVKSSIYASKKTFKTKLKIKRYNVVLKAGKKPIKKVKLYLTIKGKKYKKTFTAKTNKKGKAIFKIKKLNRKGTYTATIKFKGNKNYKSSSLKLSIKINKKKCTIKLAKKKVKSQKAKDGYVDASKAYQYLNSFRKEKGVWYWNDDDSTKTYFNTNDDNVLQPLVRDVGLENVAKIRAKEISKYFSHTRPDGSSCYSICPSYLEDYAENIAMGSLTAKEVTELWKEKYDTHEGQGHRRNMLSENYNCVGIAAYQKDGVIYWVQCFGFK